MVTTELKKGDRVRVVEFNGFIPVGRTGTVVQVRHSEISYTRITVILDEADRRAWGDSSIGIPDYRGQFFLASQLSKLVEVSLMPEKLGFFKAFFKALMEYPTRIKL